MDSEFGLVFEIIDVFDSKIETVDSGKKRHSTVAFEQQATDACIATTVAYIVTTIACIAKTTD